MKDSAIVAETSKAAKKEANRKKISRELIRFLITGIVCTVIDFAISYVVVLLLSTNLSTMGDWGGYLSFAISVTCGFVISCLVNFLLSRFFVFKNVDKNIDTGKASVFWIYFFLALGGWLIGLGVQEAGAYLCNYLWSLNISLDISKVSWLDLFNEGGLAFWAFVVIFVIKTCVTLIYNYLTRKFIIFKAPKSEDDPLVAVASSFEEARPLENPDDKPCTKESLQKIVHEELLSYYGKGQLIISEDEARWIIEDELDRYWKSHPSRNQ